MSILSSLLNKILGRPAQAAQPDATTSAAAPGLPSGDTAAPPMASGAAPATPVPGAAAAAPVDIEAVLSAKAAQAGQPLNWKTSIVDLMKLVGMDSSLAARKELAQELHYTGSTDDSAAMNVWLHAQVMQKLAANGGKLPADLAS
jgi:hypothetical protein